MELLSKFKKGQALPLNTIVIAILVIIVLLVIIVFFTSEVGETGDTLNQNSATSCADSNPALATLGYKVFVSNQQYDVDLDEGERSKVSKAMGISDCYVSKDKSINNVYEKSPEGYVRIGN